MSEELNLLIREKNILSHKTGELEFEERGFKNKLEEKDISFILKISTPLGKNKYCIGIKKNLYQYITENNLILIIGISNPRELNTHIFYVFDSNKDLPFKSGRDHTYEYIEFCLVDKETKHKSYLKTVEEFLDEREKEK